MLLYIIGKLFLSGVHRKGLFLILLKGYSTNYINNSRRLATISIANHINLPNFGGFRAAQLEIGRVSSGLSDNLLYITIPNRNGRQNVFFRGFFAC